MDERPEPTALERATFWWEEYHYRHDLIWRLLFRMTAVAVLVSIVPFTIDKDIRREIREWLDALPVLALALVAISWFVVLFEFRLFKPINNAYVAAQNDVVRVRETDGHDVFAWVVYVYPGVLIILLAVVTAVVWSLPRAPA